MKAIGTSLLALIAALILPGAVIVVTFQQVAFALRTCAGGEMLGLTAEFERAVGISVRELQLKMLLITFLE